MTEYSGAVIIAGENRYAMVPPREVVALGEMPDRVFGIFYKLVERAAAGEIEPPSIFESN